MMLLLTEFCYSREQSCWLRAGNKRPSVGVCDSVRDISRSVPNAWRTVPTVISKSSSRSFFMSRDTGIFPCCVPSLLHD